MHQPTPDEASIEAALRSLLDTRAGRSICPSEVARLLIADETGWCALMPRVREVAGRLARAGGVVLLRKGVVLDADAPGAGPIRIANSNGGAGSA